MKSFKKSESFSGQKNIAFAESQMKALLEIRKKFEKEKPLSGVAVGMALHVTKETAVLVKTLRAGGAKVAICGCNPLSTQDDVAAALQKEGFAVYAWKGQTIAEYYQNLNKVIGFLNEQRTTNNEQLATIDDGCDLVSEIHKNYKKLIPNIIVGTEETTTGVIRLRAMEKDNALKYPVIAVNDNKTKHLFDNYYGTGQSTIDGILRATSILLAGKRFVVAGYGDCGRGVAKCARGMGAIVIVCEIDPVRALQARMDGYEVMKMEDAAKLGDIFVTVTGCRDAITAAHFSKMKNNAILANAGHMNIEIDTEGLRKIAKKSERIRPCLEKFTLTTNSQRQKTIYLCGEGRLVNLACAEGHPSEVMSLSFCGQALALEYGIKNQGNLATKVHTLPDDIDNQIANLQLKAMGIKKDELSQKQKEYLSSWKTGT